MSITNKTQHWEQIENLFDTLLDLSDEQRSGALANAHTQYPNEVIVEVKRLLNKLDSSADFLEAGAGSAARAALQVLQPGEHVGAWEIIHLIDIGGQGEVYQAQRLDPDLHQTGALKINRQRFDAFNIKRFLRERQLLAALTHASIPALLDGGLTQDDQPYLVSALVTGHPIDVYVEQNKISLSGRVVLFKTVCEVIAYAHQQLTIHRDIKAANVLVDNNGHVHLLDFGVAKLLSGEHSVTQAAYTLTSASPEQIENQPISTATDVYGLGALAYRLFSGRELFSQTDAAAVLYSVLNDEPEPLSELPADLWSIIDKCLRKSPTERYASTAPLIDDLNCWLEQKPVKAMRGGHWYRFKKRIRRHTAASTAIILATLFTLTYSITITHQNSIIKDQRAVAVAEAQRNESLLNFFVDSIGELNNNMGEATTINDYLSTSLERAMTLDDPEIKAKIMFWLASALHSEHYRSLTDTQVIEATKAFDNSNLRGTPEHIDFLTGLVEMYLKADQFEIAEKYARQAFDYAQISQNIADDLRASSMLAWLLIAQGKKDMAKTLLDKARTSIEQRQDELTTEHDPGIVYILSGNLASSPAERYHFAQRAYQLMLPIQQGNHGLLRELVTLGVAENNLGRFDDAKQHLKEAYELAKSSTDGPPVIAWYLLQELARSYYLQADFINAEQYLDISDELVKVIGNDNPGAAVKSAHIRVAIKIENQQFKAAESILEGIELPSDQSIVQEHFALVTRLQRSANIVISTPETDNPLAQTRSPDAVLWQWRQQGCTLENLNGLRQASAHFHDLTVYSAQDLEVVIALQACDKNAFPELDARFKLQELLGENHWRLAGLN